MTPAVSKARIAQRGAIPPLVTMLSSSEQPLKEMAAFALGRLAQDVDNQVGTGSGVGG
jgi:HEAT repeat protein